MGDGFGQEEEAGLRVVGCTRSGLALAGARESGSYGREVVVEHRWCERIGKMGGELDGGRRQQRTEVHRLGWNQLGSWHL